MEDEVAALAATAATDAGDPLGALTALAELRGRLDQVECDQVALAVEAGWSWAAIAGALGISRQAAHKKHRANGRPAGSPRRQALRPGRILVTSEARAAVRHGREEAARGGTEQVGTEHILLGILRCDYSPAVRALGAVGVTLESAREAVTPTLTEVPSGERAPSDSRISEPARAALEQSLTEATRRADGYLGVEHLLLSLLRDEESGAVRTLRELGVEPVAVRQALELETSL